MLLVRQFARMSQPLITREPYLRKHALAVVVTLVALGLVDYTWAVLVRKQLISRGGYRKIWWWGQPLLVSLVAFDKLSQDSLSLVLCKFWLRLATRR